MNKELYVSSTPHETKVALVEDDQLAEVFFERENEYTLAGSIYKGRVTRVLPGMQSAFVDIGLERDAFLYVSDFLELPSEEGEEEEFGQIPAPRTTVDLGKTQPIEAAQTSEGTASISEPESEEESEAVVEDFAAPGNGNSAAAGVEASSGEDQESGEGARRWRGRRRRGGRRGRPDERDDRPEPKVEAASEPEAPAIPKSETREQSRPRSDFRPPAGYTPIILPGESISKYRDQAQRRTPESEQESTALKNAEIEHGHATAGFDPAKHDATSEPMPPLEAAPEIATTEIKESATGWREEQRRELEGMSIHPLQPPPSTHELHEPEAPQAAAATWSPSLEEDTVEDEAEAEIHFVPFAAAGELPERPSQPMADAAHEPGALQRLAAPLEAPEGRTLEHEVLEDEEMEFHPVPDDVAALSEVAGDEE